MIRELLFCIVLSFGGFGTVSRSGLIARNPLLAMTMLLPIGVAIYTFSSALVYAFGINQPIVGLCLMGILSIVELSKTKQTRTTLVMHFRSFLCSVTIATALLLIMRVLVSPLLTFDSYKILLSGKSFGSSIFSFSSPELASFPFMITNFQTGSEIFNLPYTVYLPVVTGFLGIISAIIILSHLVTSSRRESTVFGISVLVILFAFGSVTYMLRMQLGYLNSHLLMAGFYSLGFTICLTKGSDLKKAFCPSLSALLIGSTAFIRMEGLLLTTLLIISFVSIEKLSRKDLRMFSLISLTVPVLWYVRLAIAGASGSTIISPRNTILMLLLAAGPLVLNWLRPSLKVLDLLPTITIIALGIIFCFLLLTRGQTIESGLIFLSNAVGTGYWGAFWWTFGPLAVVLLCFGPRIRNEIVWIMTIGGGLLLILLLGAIRRVPYRIGWGDSGNRMLVHIAPLAVLYIAVKVHAWFRIGNSSSKDGEKSVETETCPLNNETS